MDESQLEPGRVLRLTITDIALGGDGVARTPEGAVVFVPFAARGDVADVRITSAQRSFLRGEIDTLIEPGEGRTEPPCPHYGTCGGCVYQHLEYEQELGIKVSQLRETLARIGRLEAVPEPDPVVASPRLYGYRNKLRLEPIAEPLEKRDRENPHVEYGYCARDNTTFFPVDRCPLGADPLNELVPKVGRTAWGRRNARRPQPFPVTLRLTRAGETHFYFGRAPEKIPWLRESIAGNELSVPLGAFWQVNNEVADALASTVAAWYRQASTRVLIDAYSGVGTFSVAVGDAAQYRVLIESDAQALAAARYNHEIRDGLKCRCVAERVERALPGALRTVHTAEATVILDPPRGGCGNKVVRTLCRLKPARILYVSCHAGTMARDLKSLVGEGGFRLERLALFDMFPRTAHFETLALLTSG